MTELNRRDFLKSAGLLTGGALLAMPALANEPGGQPNPADPDSRVLVVRDNACTSGMSVNADIVQIIVDNAIKRYADIYNLGEAWRSIFPGITSNSVIGIKANCINYRCSPRPETVQAILNGLTQMPVAGGFDVNNVILWDRSNYDLQRAGFTLNTGATGMRCFGNNQSGIGYSSTYINVNGVSSRPSRIITEHIDYMINLAVIKDHGVAGATLCLKNHYGSVNNPGSLHGNACDPYLPALNQQIRDQLGNKEKIRIIDAIFGINSGGPSGSIDFIYNGVILGEDIVAVDRVGLDILVENGMTHAYQAHHIQTASQAPYNLGNYDLSLIQRIDVVNPSANPPTNLTVTLSPLSSPVVIPAAGGAFDYRVNVVNNELFAVNFTGWTMVRLPNGEMYGPILNRALQIPAGGSMERTLTQSVPGGAPAGEYRYFARVGEYPDQVWHESGFNFTKLA